MTNVSYTFTPTWGTRGVSSTWQSLHGSFWLLALGVTVSAPGMDLNHQLWLLRMRLHTELSSSSISQDENTEKQPHLQWLKNTAEDAWLSSEGTVTIIPENHQRETENASRPSSWVRKRRILLKQLPPKHCGNSLQSLQNSNAFFQNYLNSCRRTKD